MSFFRPAALAFLCAFIALAWQENDPDRVIKGGAFPAGWSVRPDRGTPDQIKFDIMGGIYHFEMGPAGTLYKSDWTVSGDFGFSARLTQDAAPSHPISYGLMIGGKGLAGPNQTCSYFLVRNQGEFYIANREGDQPPIAVVSWTANPAVARQGESGRQTNVLAIRVEGDSVRFVINGEVVDRLPKNKLHTDGLYGFRIGNNLDVDVDEVMGPQ